MEALVAVLNSDIRIPLVVAEGRQKIERVFIHKPLTSQTWTMIV